MASATSKLTQPLTPASAAALRAVAMSASLWSKPVNAEAGNRSAIRIVDVPWPQPMSATRAPPAWSRAVTPSRAAIHPSTSAARYIGRVKRAWASLSAGWWSPQPIPPPDRKNPSIVSRSLHIPGNPANTPMSDAGLSSPATTSAISSESRNVPSAGS